MAPAPEEKRKKKEEEKEKEKEKPCSSPIVEAGEATFAPTIGFAADVAVRDGVVVANALFASGLETLGRAISSQRRRLFRLSSLSLAIGRFTTVSIIGVSIHPPRRRQMMTTSATSASSRKRNNQIILIAALAKARIQSVLKRIIFVFFFHIFSRKFDI